MREVVQQIGPREDRSRAACGRDDHCFDFERSFECRDIGRQGGEKKTSVCESND